MDQIRLKCERTTNLTTTVEIKHEPEFIANPGSLIHTIFNTHKNLIRVEFTTKYGDTRVYTCEDRMDQDED